MTDNGTKKVPANKKLCPRCGKTKMRVKSFTQRQDGTFFSWCKDCNREYARERAAAKREAKAAKESAT